VIFSSYRLKIASLLRDVSHKPESHVRERDVEVATQGEGQQRCSSSQVEAGWGGIISSIASDTLMIQSPKPGSQPYVSRSGVFSIR